MHLDFISNCDTISFGVFSMNRISELRKKYGISQKDLAQKFGLAQNTLSQYENNLRTPSAKTISNLAAFFDVPESYLLGIPPKKESYDDLKSLDIRNVTKVTQTYRADESNVLISIGWKLLHVGESRSISEDGSGYSDTVFTLGWYGDAQEGVVPNFAPPPAGWADDPEY